MESSYEDFRRGVAERLREARSEFSQSQVAEMTKYTQQMISRYENGRVPRSFWFLAGLSEAGLDVDYVLTGKKRRTPGATRLAPHR